MKHYHGYLARRSLRPCATHPCFILPRKKLYRNVILRSGATKNLLFWFCGFGASTPIRGGYERKADPSLGLRMTRARFFGLRDSLQAGEESLPWAASKGGGGRPRRKLAMANFLSSILHPLSSTFQHSSTPLFHHSISPPTPVRPFLTAG
jgi:hypothetical protein